jgi:hypothetical protein
MRPLNSLFVLVLLSLVIGCSQAPAETVTRVEERAFGKLPDGTLVKLFTLRNVRGVSAKVMTYGATITELQIPDRRGVFTNIVLGADNLDQYLKGFPASGRGDRPRRQPNCKSAIHAGRSRIQARGQ